MCGLWSCEKNSATAGQAQSPPREEGWLRPEQNVAKLPYSAQTGWSLTNYVPRMHSETWLESDHPGRSKKEASRHFLALAATPPHEEGITPARQLRHFFHSSYDRALFPEINE